MLVWAIASQKGGVGKTTTVASLAGWMHLEHLRVLVIDTDPHASLTGYLGFEDQELDQNLYDLYATKTVDRNDVLGLITHTQYPGLDLIGSTMALATVDRQLSGRVGVGRILSHALSLIEDCYDVVLIDCPPVLGALMVNALVASTEIIVPTQTEFLSLKGLEGMLRTFRIMQSADPEYHIHYIIVPTMYDRRTRASQKSLEKLQSTYAESLWHGFIPEDTRFRESSQKGMPICVMDPKCRGAQAYRELLLTLINSELESRPDDVSPALAAVCTVDDEKGVTTARAAELVAQTMGAMLEHGAEPPADTTKASVPVAAPPATAPAAAPQEAPASTPDAATTEAPASPPAAAAPATAPQEAPASAPDAATVEASASPQAAEPATAPEAAPQEAPAAAPDTASAAVASVQSPHAAENATPATVVAAATASSRADTAARTPVKHAEKAAAEKAAKNVDAKADKKARAKAAEKNHDKNDKETSGHTTSAVAAPAVAVLAAKAVETVIDAAAPVATAAAEAVESVVEAAAPVAAAAAGVVETVAESADPVTAVATKMVEAAAPVAAAVVEAVAGTAAAEAMTGAIASKSETKSPASGKTAAKKTAAKKAATGKPAPEAKANAEAKNAEAKRGAGRNSQTVRAKSHGGGQS